MNIEKRTNEIFNVLIQYEKIFEEDSSVTEETYKRYVDRLYTWYYGADCEEIYNLLKGLYNLGQKATHQNVKSTVFHIIQLLQRGEEYGSEIL